MCYNSFGDDMKKRTHSKKMKKVMGVIGPIIAILLTFCFLFLLVRIMGMNIIPDKYLILIGVVALIIFLFDVFLLIPKVKWQIKIFFSVLSIPIIALSIFGILKVNDTIDFFKKIGAIDYEVEQYYVLVLKNSAYKDISDIASKKIGVYPNSSDTYKLANSKLDEKVKTSKVEYTDMLKLANDLLNKKIDALLISDVYKSAIEEENDAFLSKVKTLYTIEVKTELDNIGKDAKVTKEPFNIYISGIDTFGVISTRSRSDVNMIMTINPTTNEILLTNIPRDYYVQLHGTTGLKDKLTHAGVYGINKSIQTIEDLMDIDINYYVRVNFNTLIKVVDTIGGIEIDSDKAFTPYTDPSCPIKKGINKLDGKCALAFSRERHAYLEGDRHRGQNQQQVITKIIEKMTESSTLISKYSSILNTLEGSFQTSLSTDEIYALIKMQLNDMPHWNITSQAVDGTGSMSYTHSYPNQKLYVMIPKESTLTEAKNNIQNIINKSN